MKEPIEPDQTVFEEELTRVQREQAIQGETEISPESEERGRRLVWKAFRRALKR